MRGKTMYDRLLVTPDLYEGIPHTYPGHEINHFIACPAITNVMPNDTPIAPKQQ